MQNPFRFGSVVSGEDFADRRRELADLGRELAGGQHVFLLSPRRYGKTSLILTLLERLRAQGLLTAYVDVFRATTAAQLLELRPPIPVMETQHAVQNGPSQRAVEIVGNRVGEDDVPHLLFGQEREVRLHPIHPAAVTDGQASPVIG